VPIDGSEDAASRRQRRSGALSDIPRRPPWATADVLDEHPDAQVCLLELRSFGAPAFSGRVATVRCFEDNVVLERQLSEPGDGRVLVVDGGGSRRCALLGDRIATLARDNGWAGLVIAGCIRDSETVGQLDIGVRALGTNPRRSGKDGAGETGVEVALGEAVFRPGDLVVADADGVVVVPA
jgi:regulator of ribonuclease activity A